jgi:hypothetical protein
MTPSRNLGAYQFRIILNQKPLGVKAAARIEIPTTFRAKGTIAQA